MIDYERKFIFIHVPKTGGVSVRLPLFNKKIGPHTTAMRRREELGQRYDELFSFAFVRNPWDRLVSTFHFLNKKGIGNRDDIILYKRYIEKYFGNFHDFVKYENQNFEKILHARPQHEFICNKRGRIIVNFVGRFEHLEKDFSYIGRWIGVQPQQLPHINKSDHKHYQEYYDDETKEIVAKLYKKDIEYFRYRYD